MKNFKGIKTGLIALSLGLVLTGCGNESSSDNRSAETKASNELALPMKAEDFQITTVYGTMSPVITGPSHKGYDLKAEEGTEYYSVAKSKVVSSHPSETAGWVIRTEILEGPLKGYIVEYLHSFEEDVVVKEGDILEAGDKVASVGMNGLAGGAHLDIRLIKEFDSKNIPVYVDLADHCKELRDLVKNHPTDTNA